MLIFSASARHLIDDAVTLLDFAKRRLWLAWSDENPRVRMPGDPLDDGEAPIADELAGIILAGLEAKRKQLEKFHSGQGLSEDEISDIDNDMSFIKAIERAIYDNLKLNRIAA